VVRLQIAGLLDIGQSQSGGVALEEVDLTDVPSGAMERLLGLIAQGVRDILYVELGQLRPSLLRFNLAANQGEVS